MKIAIIGLGYVGLPLAGLLAKDFSVVGFDVDLRKVHEVLEGREVVFEPGLSELIKDGLDCGMLSLTSSSGNTKECELKIITVGTPYDLSTDEIDFGQLDSSLDTVIPQLNNGDRIMLKSTVPPGTTMGRVREKLGKAGFRVPDDVGLIFSPERMVEGQAVNDFKTLPKIIGASDKESMALAKKVLSKLGGSLIEVSSPTVAEMVKMVDNYSRFVFIGLTNEIALMSEKIGVDVMELIKAAKFDYPRNAGILKPGPGVGGSCLNKDPFILRSHLNKQNLTLKFVEVAKEVNYGMAAHIIELVERFSGSRKRILIAGVAFKGDTNDTRFTTAFEIQSGLIRAGFEVILTDPYVTSPTEVILSDIYRAAAGMDILVLLTDHSDYSKLDLNSLKSKMGKYPLIIDTRAFIDRMSAEEIGFEYHGLGRL